MQNPQPNPELPQSRQVVAVPLPTASRPYVTYVLLAAIVIVFFGQLFTEQVYGTDPLLEFGAIDFRSILLRGEYWRLFTAMFLHGSPAHIFFNGLALWSFGQTVERFFGHVRFALIYFLGGLCGSIASFIFTRGVSVGASGAIFAIIGAEMIFLYHNRQLLGRGAQRELQSLVILALINFGIGFSTQFVRGAVIIDNWAHIGGLVAGIVLAWFIAPHYQLHTDLAAPVGYRVEDSTPLAKTWVTPMLFAVGLLAVLIYAVSSLKVVR